MALLRHLRNVNVATCTFLSDGKVDSNGSTRCSSRSVINGYLASQPYRRYTPTQDKVDTTGIHRPHHVHRQKENMSKRVLAAIHMGKPPAIGKPLLSGRRRHSSLNLTPLRKEDLGRLGSALVHDRVIVP